MGSVSPPSKSPLCSEIPSVLLSPSGAGTQKRFVAVFLAGLSAENFAGQETLQQPVGTNQRGQGGVRDIPPEGCLAPKRKEPQKTKQITVRVGSGAPGCHLLFVEDSPPPWGRWPFLASQGKPSLARGLILITMASWLPAHTRESRGHCSALLCAPLVSPSCQEMLQAFCLPSLFPHS